MTSPQFRFYSNGGSTSGWKCTRAEASDTDLGWTQLGFDDSGWQDPTIIGMCSIFNFECKLILKYSYTYVHDQAIRISTRINWGLIVVARPNRYNSGASDIDLAWTQLGFDDSGWQDPTIIGKHIYNSEMYIYSYGLVMFRLENSLFYIILLYFWYLMHLLDYDQVDTSTSVIISKNDTRASGQNDGCICDHASTNVQKG